MQNFILLSVRDGLASIRKMSQVDVSKTDNNARLEKLLQGPVRRRSTRTGPGPMLAENQNSSPEKLGNVRKSLSSTGIYPAVKRKSIKALR